MLQGPTFRLDQPGKFQQSWTHPDRTRHEMEEAVEVKQSGRVGRAVLPVGCLQGKQSAAALPR